MYDAPELFKKEREREMKLLSTQKVFDLVKTGVPKLLAEFLVLNPTAVNARDETGATPLIVAASRNRKEMIKILLDSGADQTICSNQGNNAFLTTVISGGNTEIMQLLYDRYPGNKKELIDYQRPTDGNTALHLSVKGNCPPAVIFLESKNANAEIKNNDLLTPSELDAKLQRHVFEKSHSSLINNSMGFGSLPLSVH